MDKKLYQEIKNIYWKENFYIRSKVNCFAYRLKEIILVLGFTCILPLGVKENLVYNNYSFVFWIWFIFFNHIPIALSSYVDERRYSALETLLSSRINCNSIFWGKILAHSRFAFTRIIFITCLLIVFFICLIKVSYISISIEEVSLINLYCIFISCFFGPILSAIIVINYSIKIKNCHQMQFILRKIFLVFTLPLIILYNIVKAINDVPDIRINLFNLLFVIYIVFTMLYLNKLKINSDRKKILR